MIDAKQKSVTATTVDTSTQRKGMEKALKEQDNTGDTFSGEVRITSVQRQD